jgi:hypothetical protein
MTEKIERFVGIDVSKQTLQVCVLPDSVQRCFDNSPSGHVELLQYLASVGPQLVVWNRPEATSWSRCVRCGRREFPSLW